MKHLNCDNLIKINKTNKQKLVADRPSVTASNYKRGKENSILVSRALQV